MLVENGDPSIVTDIFRLFIKESNTVPFDYLPLQDGSRFSLNAATPSR